MKKMSKIHARVAARSTLGADGAARAMRRQMRAMGYPPEALVSRQLIVREPAPDIPAHEEVDPRERRPEDKGVKDRNCNRTACQRPGAFFFNRGSSAYYCVECAVDIGCFSLQTNDGTHMDLFPDWQEDFKRYDQEYVSKKPDYARMQSEWAQRQFKAAHEVYDRLQEQPRPW